MDLIYDLARNVVNTGYDDLPTEDVEMEKRSVLDLLGCIIAGATAPAVKPVVDYAVEMGGRKESTIMMHGGKVPAEDAAFVNAVMAHTLDYEVAGGGPAHGHASIVPTAFAMGDKLGKVSGKDFLTAMVLAMDTSYRITNAFNPRAQGWDTSAVTATFGVVAMAGKLLRFNVDQLVNAFGIASSQLGGTPQPVCDGALSVKIHSALAARAGIFSTALVQRGITGPKNVLEGAYGFFKTYARGEYNRDVISRDLGKKFSSSANAFKGYPGTAFALCTTEGIINLCEEHDIKPDDVQELIVGLVKGSQDFTGVTCGPFVIREHPQVDAVYSQVYAAASAVLRRGCCLDYFTDPYVTDPQIAEMAKRVRIERVIEPQPGVFPPVKVELVLKNGQRHATQIDSFKGSVERPLSKEEIVEKFRENVHYSHKSSKRLPAGVGKELAELMDHLEDLQDVSRITELVVAE